jgi:hypothetical protein
MKNQNKKINIRLKIAAVLIAGGMIFSFCLSAEAGEITAESVLGLVNQSRMLYGLKTLNENRLLMIAASDKMNDMFSHDYFAHTSPSGVTPWSWIEKNGYDYKYAGENLAIDFKSVEKEHNAWMNSTSHRKNILNPNYQEIGIAVGRGKIDGHDTILTVQMFGTQINAPVAIDSRPEKTGEIQGEEKTNLENIENPNPIVSQPSQNYLTLPAKNQTVNVLNQYNLVNRNSFIQQLSWIIILMVFLLSVFINVAIIMDMKKFRLSQPVN